MKKTTFRFSAKTRLGGSVSNARHPAAGLPLRRRTSLTAKPINPKGKARLLRSFPFRASRHEQLLFLDLPAVRRQRIWERRIVLMNAALAMLATGKFSLRGTATVLDVSASQLSVWLRDFREHGAAGIMPPDRRRPAVVEACRLGVYLCP